MAPTASATPHFFRKSYATLFVIFALSLGVAPAWATDWRAYADALDASGDRVEAISAWKVLRFESADSSVQREASQRILSDYWQLGQFKEGIKELDRLKLDDAEALNWRGWFAFDLSQFSEAEYLWNVGGNSIYKGLLWARTGRRELAAQAWAGTDLPDPRVEPPRRSTWVAAVLSTVLPGMGQVYSGHVFDGIQAATFVGAFGLSTWSAFLYDQSKGEGYGWTAATASVTTLFYAANIYGAWKTAEYYNQSQDQVQYRQWERAVQKRGMPDLTRP